MANRIEAAIATYQRKLDGLNGVGLDGKPLSELDRKLSLTFSEFTAFQNAQARAHAAGVLTTEEAHTVYRLLGGEVYRRNGNGGWPKGVTLVQKLVVTKLMAELMARR